MLTTQLLKVSEQATFPVFWAVAYTEDLSFSARLAQRQAWKAACNPEPVQRIRVGNVRIRSRSSFGSV